MDIVGYANNLNRDGVGVWLGVADSQALVENPDAWKAGDPLVAQSTPLDPQPSLVYVKFGGDGGAMWGSESTWAALHAAHENIVPYLYCLPEHANAYAMLDAQLKRIGYRMTVFDVEYEWQHQLGALQQMLDALNTDENACALTGIAWFDGFSGAEGFGALIQRYPSLLYLAQAYLSELTNVDALPLVPGITEDQKATTPLQHAQQWLAYVLPNQPCGIILDSASIGAGGDVQDWWLNAVAPSVWYTGTLQPRVWKKLPHRTPPDVMLEFSQRDIEATNTNLGQALAYLDDLRGRVSADTDASALVEAVQNELHAARKLTRGE